MPFLNAFAFLSTVLPAVLVVLIAGRGVFLSADSGFTAFGSVAVGEAFSLLHFSTNSFTSWRFEPVSYALTRSVGFGAYIGWLYFLLTLGLACAVQQIGKFTPFRSALIALAVVFLFLHCFAFDLLVISFTLAFVWQLFVFSWLAERERPGRVDVAFVMLTTLVSGCFANQLVILSTVLAAVCTIRERNRTVLGACVVIALIIAMAFPSPPFPDYNQRGHVVPYYGVADGLQPLIGDSPPMSHIDRSFVRDAFSIPSRQLVILSAGLLLILWPRWRSNIGAAAPLWLAVALAVSLVLDTNTVDVALSQIAPLQSVSRLLPGMFFVSIAPLALAAAVILCALFAATNVFSTGLFICGLVMVFRGEPLSVRGADERLWRDVGALERAERARVGRLLVSPSYWLIREYGLEEVLRYGRAEALEYESASHFPLRIVASSNPADVEAMIDGNDHSAWTSKTGGQHGSEWINFVFSSPQQLSGIKLETGKFFFDFPRWIEVRAAEHCDAADRDFDRYEVVFRSRENQGELLFTVDGFPSFSWQYTSSVLLPTDRAVSCVLVRQTGIESHFDWSVSEVSFARKSQ